MLRRTLILSVALVAVGCADAWAGQTKVTVRGDVSAIALAGDAVIVVRRPEKADIRVERLVPGAPAQTLLRLPGTRREGSEEYDDDPVISTAVAASPQALVVSVQRLADYGASHVFVGPPTGPLREVAGCAAGLLLPAVAVSGSRVAWTSGGCGEPAEKPVSATTATIVTGDANPAVPVSLIPLSTEELPTALVLNEQTGVAGLARPTLLSFFKSEVRRLGAGRLDETLTTQSGAIVVPVGILPNGDTVHTITIDEDEGDDDEDTSATCPTSLFAIAPHSTQRRALSLPGCPIQNNETFAAGLARVAGDRVYAIVEDGAPKRDDEPGAPPPTKSLKSVRGDGSSEHAIARSGFRPPQGFATGEAGRVGWWQPSCTSGQEIVVDDGAAPTASAATPACNLRVLTRRARVRRGVISVSLRCPSGCHGQVNTPRSFLREFTLKPGTHRLRLRLKPRERRVKRLLLDFTIDNGPAHHKTIHLR